MKLMPYLCLTCVLFGSASAFAKQPQNQGGNPPQPPQEAFTACEGKSAGDSITITTPRGDSMQATCEDFNGTLAARPSGSRPSGPPPSEAN
ncbi:MAG: hypothetical protein H7A09_09180 [Oceanospirillaceae bacterium]|nr:hypothetical protein [Oceanospirillaceae bacterium]MCP5335845.1 hypothetical protein [Oceanospirillaceae bacterium]MCP5349633.1 hypothetical protein [Oceanospirillaceae bacterium]